MKLSNMQIDALAHKIDEKLRENSRNLLKEICFVENLSPEYLKIYETFKNWRSLQNELNKLLENDSFMRYTVMNSFNEEYVLETLIKSQYKLNLDYNYNQIKESIVLKTIGDDKEANSIIEEVFEEMK